MLENENNFRTATAWLAFTPSESLKDLIGDFYKPDIRSQAIGNLAIRSDARANVNIRSLSHGFTYLAADTVIIDDYKRKLDTINSHRLKLSKVSARARIVSKEKRIANVIFSFRANTTRDEQNVFSQYLKFGLDHDDSSLGVSAVIPYRYIKTDKEAIAQARDGLLTAINEPKPDDDDKLFITNPRWADMMNFERIIGSGPPDAA